MQRKRSKLASITCNTSVMNESASMTSLGDGSWPSNLLLINGTHVHKRVDFSSLGLCYDLRTPGIRRNKISDDS